MSRLSISLRAIALVQSLVLGVAMAADDFVLDVQVPPDGAQVEGPIPLQIELTYIGEGSVEVRLMGVGVLDLSFGVPEGWILGPIRYRTLEAWPTDVVLEKTQSVTQALYLHDVFSKITSGQVELPITARVWLTDGDSNSPAAAVHMTASLKIREENPQLFHKSLQQIVTDLKSEKSSTARRDLYQSVFNLTDEKVIPILLMALRDQTAGFRGSARGRLLDLCDLYNSWQGTVRYLALSGTKHDDHFFLFWHEKGTKLSKELKEELRTARSLWTRAHYIVANHAQEDISGSLHTLTRDISEISERVNNLKETEE